MQGTLKHKEGKFSFAGWDRDENRRSFCAQRRRVTHTFECCGMFVAKGHFPNLVPRYPREEPRVIVESQKQGYAYPASEGSQIVIVVCCGDLLASGVATRTLG